MDADNEPQSAPTTLGARALRFVRDPETRLRATGVLVLAALALGVAYVLPAPSLTHELPGDDALGSLAPRSIKANRDYAIPDPEATAALRDEAARAVRPVYDFTASAADEAHSRVRQAFAYVREEVARALAEVLETRPRSRRPAELPEPTDDEFLQAARPLRAGFDKLLQVPLDETTFSHLAALRFSPDLERAVAALVRAALAEEIIESRDLLLAERGHGITVRVRNARTEHEVTDVESLPDVAQMRRDLALAGVSDELASVRAARLALALPTELDAPTQRVAAALAARIVGATLAYNAVETDRRRHEAAASVKPVVLQYQRGEQIIGDGERIEARHLLVFRYVREQARALDEAQMRSGAALFAILLVAGVYRLARRSIRRFRPGKRDLVFLGVALIGHLALLRATLAGYELLRDWMPWMSAEVATLALPLAMGTLLVRLLRSGESSLVFALVFLPLASIQLGTPTPATVGLVASLFGAERVGRRTGRDALLVAGLHAATAAALVVVALALFGGRLLPETALQAAAAAFGCGVLSPLVAAAIAPLFEATFGYTSAPALGRLANLNHPVLKELIIRAPGTYHHSLIVGQLAEAAARRIGAHALLARVGGYYHDLGKASSPLHFRENQKHENRLEELTPVEAAAVLRQHIAEGIARAQEARLPGVVADFIAQHHGTRLMQGLAPKARELAERDGVAFDEQAFRYDGPKPRTREAALVMLADALEAASRLVADPTPERLRALVPRIVEPIVLEGQLDDCDLSLADVRRVIEAFQDTIVEVHGLSRVEALPTGTPSQPPAASDDRHSRAAG